MSAGGTAVNRRREYGPHWDGFANRFGIGMVGSATSNAMEAGAGLILREDPRYFRVPRQAFKFRKSGRSQLALARYVGLSAATSSRIHSVFPAKAIRKTRSYGRRRASLDAWQLMLSRSSGHPMRRNFYFVGTIGLRGRKQRLD